MIYFIIFFREFIGSCFIGGCWGLDFFYSVRFIGIYRVIWGVYWNFIGFFIFEICENIEIFILKLILFNRMNDE